MLFRPGHQPWESHHKWTAGTNVQPLAHGSGCVEEQALAFPPGAPTMGISSQVDRRTNVQPLAHGSGCVEEQALAFLPGAPTMGISSQVDRRHKCAATGAR